MKQKPGFSFTLDEKMKRNLVFFNNPILMQGLALTPVIAAAVSLKVSAVLAVEMLLLVVLTRVLGSLIHGVPRNLRMMIYALISSVIYIPVLLLLNYLFGKDLALAGGFVPLMVVDGIVLSRAEIHLPEHPTAALRNGFFTALGGIIVLLPVGAIRDFCAYGTLWAYPILEKGPLVIAETVVGGFMLVALLCAFVQWIGSTYKRIQVGGDSSND